MTLSFILFDNNKHWIIYFIYVCKEYINTITRINSFLIKFEKKINIFAKYFIRYNA